MPRADEMKGENIMGWTYYQADFYKNGKVDRKAELDSHFTWTEGDRKVTVLKSAMRGSTYYAAVRNQNEASGLDITLAVVCLTHTNAKSYHNFGYKDMDETMLPFYYDCPKGILDLLSETEDENALAWRERCRQEIERKKEKKPLPIGTVIEFPWGSGTQRAYLHPAAYQFKRPFWMACNSMQYIPRTRIPRNYTIVKEGEKT